MSIPDLPGDLRRAWIARLNAAPEVQALGLTFEDLPEITVEDVQSGKRRGYVSIGDEREAGAGILELNLIATILAGAADAKESADLLDDARVAVLEDFRRDPEFDGRVGFGRYAGAASVNDAEGRRVYGTRSLTFIVRYTNPIHHTL